MKKKTAVKLIAFSLILLLAAAICPSARAADSYVPVQGIQISFTKDLVIAGDANVPSAVCRFSVVSGAAVPAQPEEGKLAVLPGPIVTENGVVTAPTVGDVVFHVNEAPAEGGLSVTENSPKPGLKTLSKTGMIDFSGVSFPAPGVYRYLLTEQPAESAGVENDGEAVRTIDIYVEDSGDDSQTLVVAGYAMYEGESEAAPAADAGEEIAGKRDGYTNQYHSYDLRFGLAVKGNQASRYKYFTVTVELSGAVPGTSYPVDLSDAEKTISGDEDIHPVGLKKASGTQAIALSARVTPLAAGMVEQPGLLQVGADGKVKQVFYLRHDQSVKIIGLAPGVSYTVTEDPEDYSMSLGAKGSFVDGFTALSEKNQGTVIDRDLDMGFTNTRNGVIPTGVMLTLMPGAFIAAGAAAGLLYLNRKKREN